MTKETVVFIHGLGGDKRQWYAQIPVLTKNYEVLPFEIRGHGDSPYSGEFGIHDLVSDLIDFLEKNSIDVTHLVAVSMGTNIALQTTFDHPDRIKSLTLLGGFCELSATFMERMQLYFGSILPIPIKLLAGLFIAKAFRKEVGPEEREFWKNNRERMRNMVLKTGKANTMKGARALLSWSFCERLLEIKIPTLIIHGRQDLQAPLEKGEFLHKHISGSRMVIIENSGHLAQMERPEEFNKLVLEFLREVSG